MSLSSIWFIVLDKTWYAARYRLEQEGVYFCSVWCWPHTTFRLNSSMYWGPQPYKEYGFGPIRIRRFQ